VSAIEAGPAAAPERAVRKPVTKPVTHAAPLRAAPRQPSPAPSASVAQREPAPSAPAVQREAAPQRAPVAAEPAPDPKNVPPLAPFPDAQGKGRDRGAGTEAQIFQRMPWIRP
jgi:hypothetical protein